MPQPHQKRRPQNRRASGPNRSQQRESAVRAEQMAAEPSPELLDTATDAAALVPEVIEAPVPEAPVQSTEPQAQGSKRRRDSARGRNTSAPPPVAPTISHAQEYAFIRADLRRLLLTAGVVFVLMLALLFLIEG